MNERANRLWLVEIDESDWDYDRFASAVVWAGSADEAEQIVRSAKRYEEEDLWIESPDWKLKVSPAPTEGLAHAHWHAG